MLVASHDEREADGWCARARPPLKKTRSKNVADLAHGVIQVGLSQAPLRHVKHGRSHVARLGVRDGQTAGRLMIILSERKENLPLRRRGSGFMGRLDFPKLKILPCKEGPCF